MEHNDIIRQMIDKENTPPHGWVDLGKGDLMPEGLYTEDPSSSIPEGSELEVIQGPSGAFRIVELDPNDHAQSQ